MRFHPCRGRDTCPAANTIVQLNTRGITEVKTRAHSEMSQPLLTVVCLLLAKRQLNEVVVPVLCRTEWDHVLCHVRKVVTGV